MGDSRFERVRHEGTTKEDVHQLLGRGLSYCWVVGVHCDLGSASGSNGFAVQEDGIKLWVARGIRLWDGKTGGAQLSLSRATDWLGIRMGRSPRYLKAEGDGGSVRP